MIGEIRRRFARYSDSHWSADLELPPERAVTPGFTDEALLAKAPAVGTFSPDDADSHDYYRSLVVAAIRNGGRHGDRQIPIPWLRMILAGLENKHIEPEMMWYGMEPGNHAGESPREIPSFEDLFPPERGASAGSV